MVRALLVSILLLPAVSAFTGPSTVASRRPALSITKRSSSRLMMQAAAPTPTVAVKPPPGAFAQAVAMGTAKAATPTFKTLLLGFLAGAYIGFGTLLMMAVGCSCPALTAANPGLTNIVKGAFGLPFGLMMVLLMGGELYTGNTALLPAAAWEGKISVKDVARNWFLVYTGNFIGSVFVAWLAYTACMFGPGANTIAVATMKANLPWVQAFTRGILCNWLVCMAVWMAGAASDLGGKMVAIWFPISAFIAMGFEHSVANMCLIPLGMMHGAAVSMKQFLLGNLLPVTLGNTFAGVVLVATSYAASFGSLLNKEH